MMIPIILVPAGRRKEYTMNHTLIIILGTLAIYLALFVHVAFSPKISKKLIATAGGIVIICGLIFYSICFSSAYDNLGLAILSTCHAVLQLFIGENPLEIIGDSPLLERTIFQLASSTLGFLGVFTTAGAALSAIGAGFLRKLRLFLQRKQNVAIIQPLNSKTLSFARELNAKKKTIVVFVDENPDASCVEAAHEFGSVIRSDEDAIKGSSAFVWSLGIGKAGRKLVLYVLANDQFANRQYACHLVDALQQQEIPAVQTSLTIFANEDETQNTIVSTDGSYTYGSILCVSQEQLAARLLMRKAPPWEAIFFDENGRATEDFHALVVGSGKVGQAVIKQLVMNGQFAGSRFQLTIFDPQYSSICGQLKHESKEIFSHYAINAQPFDARSGEMYQFLQENHHKIKYVVLCTGNDSTNREIARQMYHFFSSHNCALPILVCSRRGLQRITDAKVERWDIFASEVLCSDDMDRLAMLLNHSYCGNDKTPRENWENCDYFSRMSSRASADFAPAFLRMVGLGADAVPEGNWYTPQQLENMAISEHERWNAFHFCMGFRSMTEEEYAERCRIYKEEKAKNPASRYRIGKDMANRLHSCLVPWDALDALSARENAVTGGKVDYKQMDRNNVLTLPALLKRTKE